VRAVLIGCGDHGGGTLIPACLSAGIRLTCLVDQNTDRARALAGQWNIPRVRASADELDAGSGADAEAAIVALPPTEQAQHAAWALSRGLHVFIEKPPALDPGELQALISHARTAGRACCVGMNFRSADGVRALTGRLRSGRYGQVAFARVAQVARKPLAPFHERTSFEACLFYAQGIHALDLALTLVPGPQAVGGQFLNVKRGLFCTITGENATAGSRFEASFGSCGAGLYHEVTVLSESGDLLSLRNLSELTCHPNGGEPSVGEYPGARVLWRRSPVGAGYASAGYETELAEFRQRVTDRSPRESGSVAELDELVPVYDAFGSLLQARGLRWLN
jgi:predicted dehydrogenase